MRKILLFMCILGMIAYGPTANAGDASDKCWSIQSQDTYDSISTQYFINPREISYLKLYMDTGGSGHNTHSRYVIVVVMNNGDKIFYGRYSNADLRRHNAKYIINNIHKCSQGKELK